MGFYRNNAAVFDTPVLTGVTATGIKVSGSLEFYKDGAEWGIAYKKHSASSWTYKAKAAKSFDAEGIASLTAGTQYDVCFFVKFNGEYQRGPVASATTISK